MADETRIERTTVLVVGGGPAGLAAAAELAHHGVRCVVVEPQLQRLARSTCHACIFLSQDGASRNAGAVHFVVSEALRR